MRLKPPVIALVIVLVVLISVAWLVENPDTLTGNGNGNGGGLDGPASWSYQEFKTWKEIWWEDVDGDNDVDSGEREVTHDLPDGDWLFADIPDYSSGFLPTLTELRNQVENDRNAGNVNDANYEWFHAWDEQVGQYR